MKTLFAVAALVALILVGAGISSAQVNDVHLNGHGACSTLNMDITISASRDTSNTVRGVVVVVGNFQGNVVELVEPAGAIDYWCVNVDVEGGGGIHAIMFFKDQISGDEFSFSGGVGLNCTNSTPGMSSFNAVDTGNFTGEVVAAPCSGSLAECNEYLSISNILLSNCHINLGECQVDLAECTDACELPALPSNHDAQFKGNVFVESLGTRVKISALRRANGEVSGIMRTSGFTTDVVEVVAPSGDETRWCVNGVVTSVASGGDQGLIGSNWLLFIRDMGSGCDSLSYAQGPGLTCATVTTVSPPEAASTADFKGKVRCGINQCCPD